MKQKSYISPLLELSEVIVESGFVTTGYNDDDHNPFGDGWDLEEELN